MRKGGDFGDERGKEETLGVAERIGLGRCGTSLPGGQFYAHLKKEGRLVRTEQYGKGLSDRMVRMCHAKCRAALDQAVQENLVRTNPAVGCKLPPKRSREMQVLSRQELQRFLIQAKADGYFELFLLDLSTGLRRGELLALQWSDLDLDTGTLSVTKQVYEVNGKMQLSVPKTKASIRKLVLPPAVVEVFREYRKTAKSRWLFPSPKNLDMPLTPGSMLRRLHIILERAECKQIRFHDLRHPYVKHTTKKYNSEKQKTQATKMNLIAWVFRFCTFNYSKRSWTL